MILLHTDRDRVRAAAEADFPKLYIELGGRRRGKALVCLFHDDHSPSASIHRGRFHCFACNLSLDVFGFVARTLRTDFRGALAYLGDRYGIPLNNRVPSETDECEYAHRRAAAEQEAAGLVAWRDEILAALRTARDWRLRAYHRAKTLIITRSLDHPQAHLCADMADRYERAYQDLDRRIETIEGTPFSVLVEFFRRRRPAA